MRKKENEPAFHHKGYEAEHNGSRHVNNKKKLKSIENMSIKIHKSNSISTSLLRVTFYKYYG